MSQPAPSTDAASPWEPLDAAYRAAQLGPASSRWASLLEQTILTAPERRRLLGAVGARAGWRVLDVGTGYGPIPVELAHLAALEAIGVDTDEELLTAAASVADALAESDFFATGATVSFAPGDAYALPFDAGEFDLVTARLVFQHLADPRLAAAEVARCLRPGGLALVYDVDDGLSASWPPASPEVALLDRAYDAYQLASGGDREVGRKLSSYLADAGLTVRQVLVLPQAAHEDAGSADAARSVNEARHLAARDAMIAAGLIDRPTFDRCLAASVQAAAVARCRIESQVVVLAGKP
ncbi:MAG TPA: methyltransferase domain-containing protein [Acidimicrobiales bacterium]|nr:methyltransferase domain-containing protein [Acidimicrobiales bacterium]